MTKTPELTTKRKQTQPDAKDRIELQNPYSAVDAFGTALPRRVCFTVAIATSRNGIHPVPLGFQAICGCFGKEVWGLRARQVDSRLIWCYSNCQLNCAGGQAAGKTPQ
jgi:hypothetical protein